MQRFKKSFATAPKSLIFLDLGLISHPTAITLSVGGSPTMNRWLIVVLEACLFAGCATQVNPSRPMSRDLPLSYNDLVEIKEGFNDHQELLNHRKLFHQPELNQYLRTIGSRLSSVSERKHLPYQFYVIDDNDIDAFSFGGGYIYVTKGLLQFVDSEAELAAVLAHEIAHVASGAHSGGAKKAGVSKSGLFLDVMRSGASAAGGAVSGPAGSVATTALTNGVEVMVPKITRRFQKHEELEADKRAVHYLLRAGYDPREYARFLDKVSKVEIYSVVRFINFLNSHPPYEERREELQNILNKINFNKSNFMLNNERYGTIRFMAFSSETVPPEALQLPANSPALSSKVAS